MLSSMKKGLSIQRGSLATRVVERLRGFESRSNLRALIAVTEGVGSR
jgi:hypothetical protein